MIRSPLLTQNLKAYPLRICTFISLLHCIYISLPLQSQFTSSSFYQKKPLRWSLSLNMQMSHSSSIDRQHSLTRFHKPTLDPTPTRNDSPVDCEDVHLAPTSPYDKEPMFEKPLTPSDVGKLNRLVIPKQYAEKYFPIAGAGGDSAGTLLGFEDEAGKRWRFRYSYWNSSQSYVLTKGWSRYVKEKCLDAGDVVVFERHRSDPDRFFIAWRRRGAPPQSCYNAQGSRLAQDSRRGPGPTYQFAQADRRRLSESAGVHSTRLVRLFGVNLECEAQSIDQSSTETASSQSSSSHQQHPIFQTQQQGEEGYYRDYVNYMGHPPTKHLHRHYNHNMEMEFTEGGMKQMGSDLGL